MITFPTKIINHISTCSYTISSDVNLNIVKILKRISEINTILSS